jgi:hypothetical protein
VETTTLCMLRITAAVFSAFIHLQRKVQRHLRIGVYAVFNTILDFTKNSLLTLSLAVLIQLN